MTEADFLRFLRGSKSLAVLAEIEFAYESAGAQTTGTIRLANCVDAISGGTKYHDCIVGTPDLERAIDLKKLGGRGARTVGSVTVNNNDGAFDWLLDVIIDGRDCEILIGGQGWARADFRTLGVGVVASVKEANDGPIVIELRDKNFWLDDTVTGGAIGSGPNAGKPKPILMGWVQNFDIGPYLLDGTALTYYFNDFAQIGYTAVIEVRDAGVSLTTGFLFAFTSASMSVNTGTDTFTYASHGLAVNDVIVFTNAGSLSMFTGVSVSVQYWVKSVPTANTFTVSATNGGATLDVTGAVMSGTGNVYRYRYFVDATAATIQLSSSPSGRVTIDMVGQDAGGEIGQTAPHSIFKYLLKHYSQLSASDYDSTAIDALATAETSLIFYGRAVLDRENLLTLLDEIAFATQSWYGWDSAGVLTVGKLALATLSAATPDDTIDSDRDIVGEVSAENLALPFGRVFIDDVKNVVVQTDGLAGAVSATNRAKWSKQFQYREQSTDPGTTGYLANWWDYHLTAIDSAPMPMNILSGSTAATDTLGLFAPWTRVHRCTVGLHKYALNPGDCVTLTYPRYGLSAGKNCRVISVKPRVTDRVVDLVLVRQATPDYTTASH